VHRALGGSRRARSSIWWLSTSLRCLWRYSWRSMCAGVWWGCLLAWGWAPSCRRCCMAGWSCGQVRCRNTILRSLSTYASLHCRCRCALRHGWAVRWDGPLVQMLLYGLRVLRIDALLGSPQEVTPLCQCPCRSCHSLGLWSVCMADLGRSEKADSRVQKGCASGMSGRWRKRY
jgi:hypothetical protein